MSLSTTLASISMRAGTRSSRTTFSMLTNHPWKPWWTAMSTQLVTNWSVFTWWSEVQCWRLSGFAEPRLPAGTREGFGPGPTRWWKCPAPERIHGFCQVSRWCFLLPVVGCSGWLIKTELSSEPDSLRIVTCTPWRRAAATQPAYQKIHVTYQAGCEHIKYQNCKTWRRDCKEMVAEVDKCVNIGPVPEVVTIHLIKSLSSLRYYQNWSREKNTESRYDQIFIAWSGPQ